MYFNITCSNCGKRRRLNSVRMFGVETVNAKWGSCGSALYCPECTKTWYERNDKPMSDSINTINVLYNIAQREAESRAEAIIARLQR